MATDLPNQHQPEGPNLKNAQVVPAALARVQLAGGWGFAWRYAAIAGALFILYFFPWEALGVSPVWLERYLSVYARVAGSVVQLFEPTARVFGTSIVGRFAVRIVQNCDAIEVKILFLGAVLAFPASLRRRAIAATLGVLAIASFNVVRLVSLYFAGVYFPTWFEALHLELWPLLLVVFATVEFLLWARWMSREAAPASAAG